MKIDIKIPKRLLPIWKPMRYKILYGGRASGKSLAIAYFLLTQAMQRKCKILCTREYQSSIKDKSWDRTPIITPPLRRPQVWRSRKLS